MIEKIHPFLKFVYLCISLNAPNHINKRYWNSIKTIGKRWRMRNYLRQCNMVRNGLIATHLCFTE